MPALAAGRMAREVSVGLGGQRQRFEGGIAVGLRRRKTTSTLSAPRRPNAEMDAAARLHFGPDREPACGLVILAADARSGWGVLVFIREAWSFAEPGKSADSTGLHARRRHNCARPDRFGVETSQEARGTASDCKWCAERIAGARANYLPGGGGAAGHCGRSFFFELGWLAAAAGSVDRQPVDHGRMFFQRRRRFRRAWSRKWWR